MNKTGRKLKGKAGAGREKRAGSSWGGKSKTPAFARNLFQSLAARKKWSFESDLAKGARFLLLFAIFSATAYALLAFTPARHGLGFLAASSSQSVLNALGVQSERTVLENGSHALLVGGRSPPGGLGSDGIVAELNDACAALIEIAVLFGIVFASFEKTPAERVKGFAAGLALLLVLNPVRIALSITYLDPLVHDVLFRLTLVVAIVGFYAAWHYGAEGLKAAFPPLSRRVF